MRETAEATANSRLSSVRGWRTLGRQILTEVEVTKPIEPVLPPPPPGSCRGSVEGMLPAAWTRATAHRSNAGREGAGCHLAPRLPTAVRRLVMDRRLSGRRRQEWWRWSGDRLAGLRGGGVEDASWTTLLQLQGGNACPGVRAGAPVTKPSRSRHSHRDLRRQYGLPGNPPGWPNRADIAAGRSRLASVFAAAWTEPLPDLRPMGSISLQDCRQ